MDALTQEIITYIIVSATAIYTLYKMVLFFIPSKNKSYCSSCSGGACGLKNGLTEKKKKYVVAVRKV
jgi:hypothetical protein